MTELSKPPGSSLAGLGQPFWIALAVMVVAGLMLRVAAALGDLSFDEVWALYILDWFAQSDFHGSILIVAAHDNTHPINSAYMAALRAVWDGEPPAVAYRTLSVLAGSATVVLAAFLGLRRGRWEAIVAAAMMAFSYPLIHYGAEARGYALLLGAAVASLWTLECWLDTDRQGWRLAFALCATVGVLSHLMFVLILAALGLLALASGRFGLAGRRVGVGKLAAAFVLPGLVATLYAAYFAALAIYGSSEPTSVVDSAEVLAGLAFGLSDFLSKPLALALFLGITMAAVLVLLPERSPRMVFDLSIIVIIPLALILLDLVKYPQPRYFLFSALFALVALARLLVWLARRPPVGMAIALLMLAVFAAGQMVALRQFFEIGRGHYAEAVGRMLAVPAGDIPVRIGSNQDYRIAIMTRYFAGKDGRGDDLIYVDDDSSLPLTWYVKEDRLGEAAFSQAITVERPGYANRFELVAVYPIWGLSGQAWALYRNSP